MKKTQRKEEQESMDPPGKREQQEMLIVQHEFEVNMFLAVALCSQCILNNFLSYADWLFCRFEPQKQSHCENVLLNF